jgi:hypothetical protein
MAVKPQPEQGNERCEICARPARGAPAANHSWADLWSRQCAVCRQWLADLEEPHR